MSKFKDASENIKRLQVTFKGLIDLADAMDSIDSLENHVKELEIKKASLINVIEGLDKDKLNAQDNLKKLNDDFVLEVEKIEKYKKQEVEKLNKELAKLRMTMLDERSDFSKAMTKLEIAAHESLESKKSQCCKLDAELADKSAKLASVTEALDKIKGGI